jgi:hypothetical protein
MESWRAAGESTGDGMWLGFRWGGVWDGGEDGLAHFDVHRSLKVDLYRMKVQNNIAQILTLHTPSDKTGTPTMWKNRRVSSHSLAMEAGRGRAVERLSATRYSTKRKRFGTWWVENVFLLDESVFYGHGPVLLQYY